MFDSRGEREKVSLAVGKMARKDLTMLSLLLKTAFRILNPCHACLQPVKMVSQ